MKRKIVREGGGGGGGGGEREGERGKGQGRTLSRVLVYYKSDQKSIRNNAVQCSVEGLLTSEPS